MIHQAQTWLPIEATTGPRVRARIEMAVTAWASRWFTDRRLELSGWTVRPEAARGGTVDTVWRRAGAGVAIGCSPREEGRILDWALDAGLEALKPEANDRRVLDAFAARLTEDLASELETALGLAQAGRDTAAALGPVVVVDLADAHGLRVGTLAMPLPAIMALCKTLAPDAARSDLPLTPRLAAAATTEVSLEVVLGRTTVGLAELRELTVGDVLVLGTPLGGVVELVDARSTHTVARAYLADIDGQVALTLQA